MVRADRSSEMSVQVVDPEECGDDEGDQATVHYRTASVAWMERKRNPGWSTQEVPHFADAHAGYAP